MSRLYEAVREMLATGKMYIVDTENGTWDSYTAAEFLAVSPMLEDARFQPRLSLKETLELCHKVAVRKAGRN